MIALDKDPDIARLPIKDINIRADKVLVTYQGKALPCLYLFEEGERDQLIKMFRSLLNKED
jgi:hypothetical protein